MQIQLDKCPYCQKRAVVHRALDVPDLQRPSRGRHCKACGKDFVAVPLAVIEHAFEEAKAEADG
jgi:transcriptional regulator NrdR family protein